MSLVVSTRAVRSVHRTHLAGAVTASVFLGFLILGALVPDVFTRFDPVEANSARSLIAPDGVHLFGTDLAGRDVFARVLYGARSSLFVGFGATLIALIAGLAVGALSSVAPRFVDGVISKVLSITMAFPEFLLALLVIGIAGPGPVSVVVAIAIAAMPVYGRVARSSARGVAQSEFVRAAEVLGVSRTQRFLVHIVPHTAQPLLVLGTIGIGTAIVSAAGLSFLGLGATPPTPEWGVIMSEGSNLLGTAPWITLFPGAVLTATVVSTSVIGRYFQARSAGVIL
ncbi:MAG: ABC transporter permease [Microbacteriaceae bacterium]